MITLGVDPGFTVTGYSVVSKMQNKDTILDCGYKSFAASKPLEVRIEMFYNFFKKKIIEFKVTNLAIETPFLGKNAQTFLKLGYLRGTLYLLASQYNLTMSEFSPKEVKRAVTGFGGAQKDQVAQVLYMLFPKLNRELKNDVTDAIAISLCGLWKTF